MQENKFFVVFKKSMRKHVRNFKCFIYIYIKKNVQNMLEYWPYATHKKTFFCFFQTHTHTHTYIYIYIYIYIYLQHFVEKPGILIPDLYFHNIKK